MASTVFSSGTVIASTWLNDVNALVYTTVTGTGSLVYSTSPTLVTPILGVATATSINKISFTAPATSATLALANGSSLITSGAFNTTLTATGTTAITLPTSGTLAVTTQATDTFGALTDITTNNVSATAHGFCPKFPNNTTTFLRGDGTYAVPVAVGTVTSISVVSTNGFAGTVANPTTTPAITLTTSITGILKGNGTAVSAAINSDLPAATATVGGAVPTPPNNTTTFLRGDATFAAPPNGLVLLATLTPTAAANVDFLTTFSATYDSYLIEGVGLNNASATTPLRMQFAVAGAADTGSNYWSTGTAFTIANAAGVSIAIASGSSVINTGKGINFSVIVSNVNDATNLKSATIQSSYQSSAAPAFFNDAFGASYNAANAVTGVRFFWNSGANFAAQGKIRIYGITNT